MVATWEGRLAEERRAASERQRELSDERANAQERAAAQQRAAEGGGCRAGKRKQRISNSRGATGTKYQDVQSKWAGEGGPRWDTNGRANAREQVAVRMRAERGGRGLQGLQGKVPQGDGWWCSGGGGGLGWRGMHGLRCMDGTERHTESTPCSKVRPRGQGSGEGGMQRVGQRAGAGRGRRCGGGMWGSGGG